MFNSKLIFVLSIFALITLSTFADDDNLSNDPFARIIEMQKRMHQLFNDEFEHDSFSQNSNGPFHFGGDVSNSGLEVKRYQDGGFKYVSISGNAVKNGNVNVDVNNGMITVTSENQNNSSSENSHFKSFSRSSQSFSIPDGVDEEKVKFISEKDKLILKFPKSKI